MKKIYVVLFAILLLGWSNKLSAQGFTIGICSGGPPSVTTSSTYGPMYSVASANATSRIAVIYPASQLAGIAGTTLTNIYFNRATASGSMAGTPSYKIYLQEVSQADWGSAALTWDVSSATLVYDGDPASIVGSTAGWVNFPFLVNFPYTGNQNLAVYMEYNNPTASTAIAWSYEYNSSCTVASNNATKYTNNTTGTLPTSLSSSNLRRPYVGFDYVLPPCIDPPVAGTAGITPTGAVCSGQAITLSLTGNTTGSGLTYEWESSPTDVPFTPTSLGAASASSNLIINPTSTLWYRAKLICNGGTPVYSNTVQAMVNPVFPANTYTIDPSLASGGTNFQTFTEAVSAISCGIGGPIVFNVAAGTYNEQINFPETIGANATNTVTFNGNGATLTYGGSSTDYPTLNLDGADYITFNNLNIEATGATNSFAVHLMNSADNNTFNNCNITANATATASTSGCVNMSGSTTAYNTAGTNGMNNTFNSCNLTGGYFGFVLYGTSNTGNTNNNITNCTVKEFYVYGMYLVQQADGAISGNIVERPTRASTSTFYGTYLSTGCSNILVEKNRYRNPFTMSPTSTSTAYTIYVTADASAGNENKIINNLISDFSSNGSHYGLYLSGGTYIKAYHNTISFDNTASTAGTTYGIYATGTAGVDIKNNIVYIARGGSGTKYCLYFSGAGKTSANNNLFISSTAGTNAIGYYSTGFATLSAWQGANGSAWDQNSVSAIPLFTNPSAGDYTPGNGLLDDKGTPVNVLTDIVNVSRDLITPDVGAYEFYVPMCGGQPVAGTITGPAGACNAVPFTLTATGYTTVGSGLTYEWQFDDGSGAGWQTIAGASNPTYTSSITIPTDFRFVVTCSNGGAVDYSNTLSLGINPPNQCYCIPAGTNSSYYINNLSTTGGSININNAGSGFSPGGYGDFTATDTVAIAQGQTFTINAAYGGTSTFGTKVWIDWDGDGDFTTAGDQVYASAAYVNTASIPISIPLGANPITTRMRIGISYTPNTGPADPCLTNLSGEYEDYTITIEGLIPCNGTPSSTGTAAISNANICVSGNTTLSISGYPFGGGLDFNWESSPAGQGNFQPIIGASGTTPYSAAVTASTDFRMAVTCMNTGDVAYSNIVTATVDDPQLISTTPGSRCGTGSVTLGATTSAVGVNWYNAATGGTLLYSGTSFTTPIIANTTTYYAAATSGTGTTQISNMPATLPNVSTTTYAGIIIDVYQDLVLKSVNVFSINGGTVAVELRNNAGTLIYGPTSFPLVASTYTTPQNLVLNIPIPVGTGYRLLATPSASLAYQGGTYPLPLGNGVGNVVNGAVGSGTSTSTLNYYFYNLETSTSCESARVAVDATVNPAPAYTLSATPDTVCQGSSSQLEVSSANAYTYTWTPGSLSGSAVIVTPATTTKYYVSGVDGNNCSMYDSVTVAVKSVPATVATVAAQPNLCLSGDAVLSLDPAPMAGIGIQWQSNTGSGFTDIPGATTAAYTETISATTSYQALLSCDNTLITTSTPTTVTVNNPAPPTVFPGSRCDAGVVTLAATPPAGAGISWYDASTGGNFLGSGNVYVTPSIATTTTYYAASVTGGGTAYVGPISANSVGSTGGYYNYETYRTYFTVTSPLSIISVDVFPQTVGQSGTIKVYTTAGVELSSTSYTTTSSGSTTVPQTVTLNTPTLVAGDYYMKMGETAVNLYRNDAGATFPYTTSGISITGQSFSGYPNYYYYFYNWKVSSGCESNRVPVAATITGAASGTGLAAGGTVAVSTQADGTTVDYNDGCSDKVATIEDAAGGNTLGNTVAMVLTSGTVQTFGGQPYVGRVYDITPSSSGAAMVSLYVLQSEFTAYNNYVTSGSLPYPLLPQDPFDATGIANIAITQYHGGASAGTTGPNGLYDVNSRELIPNSSITTTWNGSYWTLKFPVSNFSGFFIHGGNTPLEIRLGKISAVNIGARNRVDWNTEAEQYGESFIVERSLNGRDFTKIGAVNAIGKASTYSYWDEKAVTGINYYRLQMVAANGTTSYSRVVSATVKASGAFTVEAHPNPVTDQLTVNIYGEMGANAQIQITDAAGRLIKTISVADQVSKIDMSGLAHGLYFLKYNDQNHTETIKVDKQ